MTAHPRLSLNQATIRHATLATAIDACAAAGIGTLGVWRHAVADIGAAHVGRMLSDAGIAVSGLCHSAPLCVMAEAPRAAAHDDNLRAIDEAAELWGESGTSAAPTLTLVAGGLPAGSRDLAGARERSRDAVGELVQAARAAGVRLGIEPFHPMLAADRGVIATLAEALTIAEDFDETTVGVVLDSWHVWWDPALASLVRRAAGRLFGVQVADWLPSSPQLRGLPGAGAVDFAGFLAAVSAARYTGPIEVEIFNPQIWDAPVEQTVADTVAAFDAVIAPALSA